MIKARWTLVIVAVLMASPAVGQETIPGDANRDCHVDAADIAFMTERYGMDPNEGDNWKADLNEDGAIDTLDFQLIDSNWERECEPGPEDPVVAGTIWPDWTKCPPVLTVCPTLSTTVCPPSLTNCPRVTTVCPLSFTSCPAIVPTECPWVSTVCPLGWTSCPAVPTECPVVSTSCPAVVPTECPSVSTVCPLSLTSCPPIPTECPSVSTVCPAQKTHCPQAGTECPVLATRCAVSYDPTLCADGTGSTWTHCPFSITRCPQVLSICELNPADLNIDGTVNILDLLKVRNNLRKNPLANGVVGDINGDDVINILDMLSVRNELGWQED